MASPKKIRQAEAILAFVKAGGYSFDQQPIHEVGIYVSAQVEDRWIIKQQPRMVEFRYDPNFPEIYISSLASIGMFISYKPYAATQFEYSPDRGTLRISGERVKVRFKIVLQHDLPEPE